MKLEDQVTNLELSEKLKELGVKQESYFYHVHLHGWGNSQMLGLPKNTEEINELVDGEEMEEYKKSWNPGYLNSYSAFTSDELINKLPNKIEINGLGDFALTIIKGNNYIVTYKSLTTRKNIESFSDSRMANSLAKMLIYLIENNLLPIP